MSKVSDENSKVIRGKALYYSTSQVANILNQSDSKIRYYTNVFDEILNIEISNKQRRYTEADIDKMRFLIELKDEGMTIKQIQEYCQQVDFENSKEIQIKENNPLSIQSLAKALLEEQSKLMLEMKNELIKCHMDMIEDLNNRLDIRDDRLKEDISITVDNVLSDKLDNFNSNINSKFESIEKELSATKQMNEKIDHLREAMKERKEENEEIKNKSFWSKLFQR
ncbi:helix-turn-helix domain-containing protein [Clostridium butyricum]|uniref:helix-turn-helix domain-containing protein n=1 Tax=Clostridium butyricum TaxID=1492 RepID=UPI003465C996